MPSDGYLRDFAAKGMRGPAAGQQAFKIGLLREGATRMTCVEAHCAAEANGWVSVLDPANAQHAASIKYITDDSGRRYLLLRSGDALEHLEARGDVAGITVTPALRTLLERTPAGFLVFLFFPGQQCFRPHLDREVLFAHQQRDQVRIHTRPLDFNEQFNEEGDRVNELLKRG